MISASIFNSTRNATVNSTLDCDPTDGITPSVPVCIGLSALGGVLEVASTMFQAYPEYRKKLGHVYTPCQEKLFGVGFGGLMAFASVSYVAGSWFGPVSIAVPSIMVSKLLGNLCFMGVILRMEDFTKEQQIGTYCITCAILTLPEVGPSDQDCIDVEHLIQQPGAIIWELILFGATAACCIGMVRLARQEQSRQAIAMLVYVTAQVVSAVINASVSKMLPLVDGILLGSCFLLAVVCAAVNVISLALAARSVDQGIFIPYATCSTLITNMITGQIV